MFIRRRSTRLDGDPFAITEQPERNLGIIDVLCYGDVHLPYHDPDACALMWRIAVQQIRPDIIVNLGDELDFPEISFFRRSKPKDTELNEAKDLAKEHFRWLRKTFPDAEIWFLPGNHDERWNNYLVDKAPEFTAVPEMQLEHVLGLEELNIQWVERKPRGVSLNLGYISVGHWNKISKHSAYTAKLLVEQLLHSCLQAHSHRLGAFYHTGVDVEIVGYENGCLCRLDPHYDENPNWQQGFSVIHILQGQGYFHVENIPIVRVDKKGFIFAFYAGQFYKQPVTIKLERQAVSKVALGLEGGDDDGKEPSGEVYNEGRDI